MEVCTFFPFASDFELNVGFFSLSLLKMNLQALFRIGSRDMEAEATTMVAKIMILAVEVTMAIVGMTMETLVVTTMEAAEVMTTTTMAIAVAGRFIRNLCEAAISKREGKR